MATTTYVDDTLAVFAIGDRTDAAGVDVDDVSAEESRLINQILTPGILEPTDGWGVAERGAGANMSVDVGSGTAKADIAVVEGSTAGQGRYLVRKEAGIINVTVPAADVSQARTDEVYLVVADAPYDGGSLSLPRIGYRQGDAGGGAPGPDAGWDAYLLLASISVAASATQIDTADIDDERVFSRNSFDHASIHDLDGSDPLNWPGAFEVDGSSEVAGPLDPGSGGSTLTLATVGLGIPSDWGSYKISAFASYVAEAAGTADATSPFIEIGGVAQQTLATVTCPANTATNVALGARRTGSTSGTVILKAQSQLGVADLRDIYLYARAVRTS